MMPNAFQGPTDAPRPLASLYHHPHSSDTTRAKVARLPRVYAR
jgi:hypothetical protein